MLKHAAKIEFNYVPFPGGAPVVTTLLGGHVSAALANYVDVQENLGINLRALVVGAAQRLPALKDVPTLAEAGFGDIIAATWFGLMVPAKTGKEVVGQMATLFKAALEDADVKAKLSASGLTPVGMCGAEFEQHLKAQHAAYARIIKEANVKG